MRLANLPSLLVALSLLFCIPTTGQICPRCKIPASARAARIAAAEATLVTAASQQAELRARHLPFGVPVPPADAANERLLYQLEWIASYDDDLRVPLWVGYELTAADADAQRERKDCFRHDGRLPGAAMSGCDDYADSIFDRGHMVPADDLKRSAAALDNSFLFSNMHPQFEKFNQVVWRRLEAKVNKWAIESGYVLVISGAIFDRDGDGRRDPDADAETFTPQNRVALGTHFYKIVIHHRPTGVVDTISFVLPHNNNKNSKDSYFKSKIRAIDEIEGHTGIDFFPDMDSVQQGNIEAGKVTGLGAWFTF